MFPCYQLRHYQLFHILNIYYKFDMRKVLLYQHIIHHKFKDRTLTSNSKTDAHPSSDPCLENRSPQQQLHGLQTVTLLFLKIFSLITLFEEQTHMSIQ